MMPGRLRKNAVGDVEDLESGDPTRLMPRLRQIHKMSGLEKGSFLADLHPNVGESVNDGPKLWRPGKVKTAEPPPPKGVSVKEWDRMLQRKRPGKLKQAAGLLPNLTERQDVNVALHSVQEQHYLEQMGSPGGDDDEDIPLELLTMAGGGVAQGAQMARMARSLESKANARLARRAARGGRPALMPMQKRGYKLQGKTEVQGIPISIENRRGSVRKGKDSDGNEWRTKMKHPYGYIRGTKGADGEPVDAYVGPDKEAPNAFVVHQKDKETGAYDEDKVMLGFGSKREAKEAFLAHYDSPKFLGPISRVSVDRLRELVASKGKLVKISHVSWQALLQEICALEKVAEVTAATKKRERGKLIRKAGPGIGGLIGAGVGAAIGARRGKLLKGAVTGLGTGATLGWTPAMAHDATKAVKRYRERTK